ncbi:MAG: small multi-drug export protein [Oscillospiraceae bacterium]|nr:small multi-drug export protein [Oscillospiraceae bacterium]
MAKYLTVFFVSMVPIVELRGAMPIAMGMDIPFLQALLICAIGNMIPVPIVYFFARKFLIWGVKQKYIGKFCNFFLVKGEHAGQKLVKATGRGGLFIALMVFVGIPLPGTGAWTGTLGASFLDMGFKSTVVSVSLGVVMAGIIMALASTGAFAIFGF